MRIKITLSSACMGDVDEVDFDIWAKHVADRIEAVLGEGAQVDQLRFGDPGADEITGATDEERDAIRNWLAHEGWDEFCESGGTWETLRKIADAA